MPANQSTPEVTRAPVRIALEDVTPTIAAAFGDDLCLIWSGEWQAYWRAGGNGYTKDVAQAGWYTIQAAYARTCHCDPSKQIAFERPDATPARGGDELREEITQAIARADAAFGYAYRMTKMDETGEEHTLFMDGFEPAVFEEREDGYPVIEQRRNTLRADAILAALASTDMAGAGEKCALPPKGWSCTRTPGHDGPCAAVPNDNSLEDEIAEALTDSLDMDWTSSVGARHVMALLREKGIVS